MKFIGIVIATVLAAFGLALVLDPPATFDIWVLRKQAILLSGVVAFALMSLIMLLAVRPALVDSDWRTAAINGALFGFFAYATYDLTNLATLKVWSLKVSLIDMAWGTVLTGVTATAGAWAALRLAE